MARTRKAKPEAESEAPPESPPKTHNQPQLTDDEKRALLLQHKRPYVELLKAKKDACAAFLAACKKAKAECGPDAVADIKDMILMETPEGQDQVAAEIARQHKVARWMWLPVGAEPQLFDTDRRPADDKSYDEGRVAGMAGDVCKPPAHVANDQKWIEGWQDGQAVLLSAFEKIKAPVETPAEPASDAEAA